MENIKISDITLRSDKNRYYSLICISWPGRELNHNLIQIRKINNYPEMINAIKILVQI